MTKVTFSRIRIRQKRILTIRRKCTKFERCRIRIQTSSHPYLSLRNDRLCKGHRCIRLFLFFHVFHISKEKRTVWLKADVLTDLHVTGIVLSSWDRVRIMVRVGVRVRVAYTIRRVLAVLGLWSNPARNLRRAEHFAQMKYRDTKSSDFWITVVKSLKHSKWYLTTNKLRKKFT